VQFDPEEAHVIPFAKSSAQSVILERPTPDPQMLRIQGARKTGFSCQHRCPRARSSIGPGKNHKWQLRIEKLVFLGDLDVQKARCPFVNSRG
jgi:hypothetical protein